ncbi:DeoR/GlpR family DNA-binding transcription regulator [Salinispira pacifica]
MYKKQSRLSDMLHLLQSESGVTIRDLASRFKVSPMTIRRDLSVLEDQNLVKTLHGTAVFDVQGASVADSLYGYAPVPAETVRVEEKRRIGQLAASLIQPEDVVIIDSGTTTKYIAKSLPVGYHYTVLCLNLNSVLEARKLREVDVVLPGGYYHENTTMFVSPEGIQLVKNTRARLAFISAMGVSMELGLTCGNAYETEPKRAAIASSLRRILVVDSTKFGRVQPYHFAEITDFHAVITDAEITPEQKASLEKLGIEVLIA